MGAVEDRLCKASQGAKRVKLSAQELIDCDQSSNGCKGGTMNRVLAWGKRKGFVEEECYSNEAEPVEGSNENSLAPVECTSDTLTENECRMTNNIYKVVDYCLA